MAATIVASAAAFVFLFKKELFYKESCRSPYQYVNYYFLYIHNFKNIAPRPG